MNKLVKLYKLLLKYIILTVIVFTHIGFYSALEAASYSFRNFMSF